MYLIDYVMYIVILNIILMHFECLIKILQIKFYIATYNFSVSENYIY